MSRSVFKVSCVVASLLTTFAVATLLHWHAQDTWAGFLLVWEGVCCYAALRREQEREKTRPVACPCQPED